MAQIILHASFPSLFFPFSEKTWIAVIIYIIFFNIGTIFVNSPKKISKISDRNKSQKIEKYFRYFIIIYAIASTYATSEIYRQLTELGGGNFQAGAIRQLVVLDFLDERSLYSMFRIFYMGVGFSIFLLAFSRNFSTFKIVLICIIGLLSAIATTGRLYILLFFISSVTLLYRNNKITLRHIIFGCLAFLLLFFALAVFFEKGEKESIESSVVWNAQVYAMSSLACFNNYIVTGNQEIPGGALLPNPARNILGNLEINLPPKPALLPFAVVPVNCNTYTALFPLMHDGGLIGILLGAFIIGIIHQYLYRKYRSSNNPIWWYAFSISLYPLIMSIFEDSYFSSPGFWAILWTPPLFYFIFANAPRIRMLHHTWLRNNSK
jgi:oligosaccharide repeat unit polymerase